MRDLTTGNEAKLIFNFALPMLIGNVFQQLYSSVDGIIVGRFLGKGALASVGVSFPVIFLLVSLIMGIGMGTTILIAQYFGAQEMGKVKDDRYRLYFSVDGLSDHYRPWFIFERAHIDSFKSTG